MSRTLLTRGLGGDLNSFDHVAGRFEEHRALPVNVPGAICRALLEHAHVDDAASMLEIGCGTGRVGSEFVVGADDYVGLDLSFGMLSEFRHKNLVPRPRLVCADGCLLPFPDGAFGTVLLVHLTSMRDWRALVIEARRVLGTHGVLAIGMIKGSPGGVESDLRSRLNELIADAAPHQTSRDREAAGEWLRKQTSRYDEITVAEWVVQRSPNDFIRRKLTAAPFLSLSAEVRNRALRSLADWAEETIGPLDEPVDEQQKFSLKLHWFEGGRS